MPTEKLFYHDAYLRECEATVLSCNQKGEVFVIELDKTCFYPEGGGQNADTGTIAGIAVIDVHEREGVILHTAAAPLAVGERVRAAIDWPRRFSLMQHHTAEHIVSGIVNSLFGLDNVGFHMGSAMVTIDFNGELSAEDIEKAELLANETVFANLEVAVRYPGPEQLKALSYRSKKELSGEVRIVEMPGADRCACCGTHVARTGEVGLIKLLSPQRYKGGTRIGLLCGGRALADYRQKDGDTAEISHLLSAKQHEVAQAVRRVMAEAESLKMQLAAANDRLFSHIIGGMDKGGGFACLFAEGLSPNDLRRFCAMAAESREGPVITLCGGEGEGYRYALGTKSGDARELSRAMHAALGGKGGGKAALAQGSIPAGRARIEEYFLRL